MKRENKAYSYKEQIIELELQAELNKKKGIKEELQLSSKQKEMIQAQQDREASIRKRLQLLDSDLQSAVGLLEAALIEKPSEITMELPAVLQVLLPLLPSPLAAPRLLRPECDLDPAWEQEDLETAANRTILLLHHHTVPQRDNKTAVVAPLSAPAFSVCFPLLNAVVKKSSGSSEDEESQLIRALQVISEHCQLRSAADSDDMTIDENGPELLPRTSMLMLLIRVISTATPRLQDGCTVAEQQEIDVLLEGLLSPCFSVRDAALRGLCEMEFALPTESSEESGLSLLRRLWVTRFDVEEECRALLWESLGLELVPDLCSLLIVDVTHHEEAVRSAAAEALSSAVSTYRDQAPAVLGLLTQLYHEKLYRPPPVLDALGRVISEAPPDQWEARGGIALALNKLSQFLEEAQVTPLFLFFVPDALNDRHPEVRRCMLDAALSALNTHGKDNVSCLLPVFEEFLKNAPQDASYDSVRQSVVILMGSLAKHLDKNDPKVQESVAGCLPPLVPAIREDAAGIVRNLLQLLLESDKYAERKGAAYGLAGLVKGLGILALKQQDIMSTLTDGIQDKKNFRRREGM
ncbi:hypothetical protein F7725_012313 [Dissostichus mawsoni]|uniref:TOG domain-containing protein n=1 Tax=Dissostichus mawsoni TaxID=36200 RepID=A0A7J5YNL8_DISMA|nr:hypothetical protein F7725_012313 [Dissostichus mawsoni]